MSKARRQIDRAQKERRRAEAAARCQVTVACEEVRACGVPMTRVTRRLGLSDRTVRRWRHAPRRSQRRGRPPSWATSAERSDVARFLMRSGPATPLAALRRAFPQLRRADLANVLARYRRVMRRRGSRYQCRLEWRRAGAVWAADFKERREPLEGRYGWLLSIKDLGSGYQLAWEPLVEATAPAVQAIYARLFEEHGPPLVLKTDNGGQFKADDTKALLAEYEVLPLYSPKRHPQYNGAVERANGQVTRYQQALAEHYQRPAGPTCDDAEGARLLANELAHPQGWRGATAATLWEQRLPILPEARCSFRASVADQRAALRTTWQLPDERSLTHYEAAAVDRRAIRDALLAHDLLRIHPRRSRRTTDAGASTTGQLEHVVGTRDSRQEFARALHGAGTIAETDRVSASPMVGGAPELPQRLLSWVRSLFRGGPFLRQ